MDMSGAMPTSARYEIRDAAGELLTTVAARIDGGTVSADLPAFAPGTLGRVHLITVDADGAEFRENAELEELPSSPIVLITEMG